MKVTVEGSWRGNNSYTVRVQQGVQSFRLDYTGTREDALWYARQFRHALKNHDTEVIEKYIKEEVYP